MVQNVEEGDLWPICGVSSELFQLVAVHLPRSGDQEVEARELSIVLCDVSPHPGAASFGREVHVIGLYFMYQVLQ